MIDLLEEFDGERQGHPLISVIIPAYNAAGHVANAVVSAATQTHKNIEIIVINDGSTDDTLNILRQLYVIEPRVRIIDQPNGGVSAARNNAIRTAKGDFIAFLDSDDRWNPRKLERQLARLTAEAPDGNAISTTAFTLCYSDGHEEERPHPDNSPKLEMIIQRGFFIMPSSWVIPRGLFDDNRVGLFDEQLNFGEDTDWVLRALKSGVKPLIESEGLTFYAVPEVSKRYKNQLGSIRVLIERHKDWVCENYPSCITDAFLKMVEKLRTEDCDAVQVLREFGIQKTRTAQIVAVSSSVDTSSMLKP